MKSLETEGPRSSLDISIHEFVALKNIVMFSNILFSYLHSIISYRHSFMFLRGVMIGDTLCKWLPYKINVQKYCDSIAFLTVFSVVGRAHTISLSLF